MPPTRSRLLALLCLALGLATLTAGCGKNGWFRKKPGPEPPPPLIDRGEVDPLLVGSIGEETLLTSSRPKRLRGFGVVVGLEGRGSSDCPTVIREYLMDYLAKLASPTTGSNRRPRFSPSELLDSDDSAVVEVSGFVPAGARSGTRFDVEVKALAGTGTTSLSGGLLLPAALRVFDAAASGRGLVAGAELATAEGPVLMNPYAEQGSGTADARVGVVLGGARAREPRPVRLTLIQPNYAVARAIERRINERFQHLVTRHRPDKKDIADAWSMGYVMLNTPAAYAERVETFHQLVIHLSTDKSAAAMRRRLETVNRTLKNSAITVDQMRRIAWIWEGIGRAALPQVKPYYAHENPLVRLYAAQAGLRLNDLSALPILAELAQNGVHSHRLVAIRELGWSTSPQAALRLAPLLSEENQEVRVAAYTALLKHGHPAIRTEGFVHVLAPDQLNFYLDIVDCDGPPLVYVRRAEVPRIVLFGRQQPLILPVFYSHGQDNLTIVTVDGTDDVRIFMERNGRLTDDILVPPQIDDVLRALGRLPRKDDYGNLQGIGLPYTRVVEVLTAMAETDTLSGRLAFEQTSLTDLLGPTAGDEPLRPEGDHSADMGWPEFEDEPANMDSDEPAEAEDVTAARPEAG
jgi:hypothetical protein